MIEILPLEQPHCIGIKVDGRISEADMAAVFDRLEQMAANHDRISVYEEVRAFGWVEFKALKHKFRYLRAHGLHSFDRIAVVTDKAWVRGLARLEAKLFRKIEIRAYSLAEKDKALAFVA